MYNVDPYENSDLFTRLSPDVQAGLEKLGADLSSDLDNLNDEDFALILVSGDPPGKLRKFATVDTGNVVKSSFCLLHKHHDLPREAVKIAAANLRGAAALLGLEDADRQLEKLSAQRSYSTADNFYWLEDADRSQMTKQASRAPIETRDIRDAVVYLEDNREILDGWEKRSAAKVLVPFAKTASVDVPQWIERYAGDGYSPDLPAAIAQRQSMCVPEGAGGDMPMAKVAESHALYHNLFLDSSRLSPDEFASKLAYVDRVTGLEGLVDDAVYTTFGKTAAPEPKLIFEDGTVRVYDNELEWFARHRQNLIQGQFTNLLADQMQSNPVDVFKSLPTPTKLMLARLIRQEVAEDGELV